MALNVVQQAAGAEATGHPRRWWILAALWVSLLVIGLDLTVLNVALPVLVRDLRATTDQLQWMVDAYALVLAGLLLFAGSLGDRVGRKKVLMAGLAVFGIASLLSAYAPSADALIAARALLGVGGAIIFPLSLGTVPIVFSEEERPRAISVWLVGTALGVPLGPIVGGWLLDHFWWGSVFLLNVPFIVVSLTAVGILVPESRDPRRRPLDPAGAALATAGLGILVYGIIQQPVDGWSGIVVGALGAGALLLACFALWETRNPHPMLDLRLFASARFTWSTIAVSIATMVLVGLLFVLTQYLQDVRGYDPLGAGVRLLPLAAGVLVGSPLSVPLVARFGTKVMVALGLVAMAAGLALLATTSPATGYAPVGLYLFLISIGIGVAMAPAVEAMIGALPAGEFGVGTALSTTFRMVGAALGVALIGDIMQNRYRAELALPALPARAGEAINSSIGAAHMLAAGLPAPLGAAVGQAAHSAFVAGMDASLVASVALALVAAILVVAFLPARAPTPGAGT